MASHQSTDRNAPAGYSTGDKTSFGWTTARERWPIIIVSIRHFESGGPQKDTNSLLFCGQTQAIDDVYRSVSQCEAGAKQDEGKRIVEDLSKLKYEVQHDRPLTYVFLHDTPHETRDALRQTFGIAVLGY
jgi:hypothetical protein